MTSPENTFTLPLFFCLNNYYNIQMSIFLDFFLKIVTFKEAKTVKNIFSMKKWDTNELRQPIYRFIFWSVIP